MNGPADIIGAASRYYRPGAVPNTSARYYRPGAAPNMSAPRAPRRMASSPNAPNAAAAFHGPSGFPRRHFRRAPYAVYYGYPGFFTSACQVAYLAWQRALMQNADASVVEPLRLAFERCLGL